MSADAETAHAYRGMIARAVQRSSNDNGGSQTANVEVHRHIDRTGVEIITPFGFASRSPAGGEMIVLAVGGDQGDLAGLPTSSPAHRLGGLEEGEAAMHNLKGDRVHVKADGGIDSTSRNRVKSKVKDATVEVLEDRIIAKLGAFAAAHRRQAGLCEAAQRRPLACGQGRRHLLLGRAGRRARSRAGGVADGPARGRVRSCARATLFAPWPPTSSTLR